MNKILIKHIEYGTPEYHQELALRERVLRFPLGLKLNEEDIAGEKDQIHFIAVVENKIVGCVILTPQKKKGVARLRQLAVDEPFRRRGIARMLVVSLEKYAKKSGYKKIILSARDYVVALYEKFGFNVCGESFPSKTGIDFPMSKIL